MMWALLYLLIHLIALPRAASGWDLAVAVDERLELINLTVDGKVDKKFSIEFQEPISATALAFDKVHNVMFVSDTQRGKLSAIYSLSLHDNHETKQLIQEPESEITDERHRVLGIAYDHHTNTLFWTNGAGKSILYLHPKVTNNERAVLLNVDKVTTGLALDICSRSLFWTTKNGTIERCDLDGKNHMILFSGINNPTDITVDEKLRRLYWCDDSEGIYFKIESCNLDGSDRKVVVHHINQKPLSIATTPNYIYWTDVQNTAIWRKEKEGSYTALHQFTSGSPKGIISQDHSILFNECRPQQAASKINGLTELSVTQAVKPSVEIIQKGSDHHTNQSCLNGCTVERERIQFKCPPGYSGPRCEMSACYNYCLYGTCLLDAMGIPQCLCPLMYQGERCEVNVCKNYCLNEGQCSVNEKGEAVCKCVGGYQGIRCEISCLLYCQQHQTIVPVEGTVAALCSCSNAWYDVNPENSSVITKPHNKQETDIVCVNYELMQILVIILSTFCFILLVLSALLLKKVFTLRKRPRIKKRIIVNKNVTPLTSSPAPQPDQCEITIENCCNMNICETPCYEPQLRTSKALSKTEEKKNLLGNMEEGSSCSPCQDNLY